MWQICWRLRSDRRSPSVQFGQVHASRLMRGFVSRPPSLPTLMLTLTDVWFCETVTGGADWCCCWVGGGWGEQGGDGAGAMAVAPDGVLVIIHFASDIGSCLIWVMVCGVIVTDCCCCCCCICCCCCWTCCWTCCCCCCCWVMGCILCTRFAPAIPPLNALAGITCNQKRLNN